MAPQKIKKIIISTLKINNQIKMLIMFRQKLNKAYILETLYHKIHYHNNINITNSNLLNLKFLLNFIQSKIKIYCQ